jgi:hypothetical protein
LILWFLFLSFFARLFRRLFDRGQAQRGDRSSARAPGSRSDGQSAQEAKRRFEFKKRHAVEAGSMGYIWRTGSGECPQHRDLDGRFVPWDNPPLIDGVPVHAGERSGCTCRTEIVH